MTRVRQMYLFARRIGWEDLPSALELASSIMDKEDQLEECVINGETELAEAFAEYIARKTPFTETFSNAFDRYTKDGDILGLISRYKAAIYGGRL